MPGQSIFINTPDGKRIVITNCGTRGRQTKIGINAPPEYNIVREELVQRSGEAHMAIKQAEAVGYVSPEQIAEDQSQLLHPG